jgi:two-component system response regulator DctR
VTSPGHCAALKNGAFDFLEKPIDDAMLLDVLRSALRADRERRAAATARASTDRRIERMAQREQEIVEFIAAGQQHREIATRLAVSALTVEVHKAHIMEKPAVEIVNANRRIAYCLLARGAPGM